MKLTNKKTGLVLFFILAPVMFYAQSNNQKNKEVNMQGIETNKAVIKKLYEECLNKRNMVLLNELVSAEYTGIKGLKGATAFEMPVAALIKSFPDIQWQLQQLIGEGNKVMVQWKWQGTQKEAYLQYQPTNKMISNDGMAIFELKDGKIIQSAVQTDRLGFLQSLEVLPLEIPAPAVKSGKDNIRFIDKFLVPAKAKEEFLQRVQVNRALIKKLPGFIEDAAYEHSNENGDLVFITIAVWENNEAVKNAKEAVQAAYKKEGFDMPAFIAKTGITLDRGIYTIAAGQ